MKIKLFALVVFFCVCCSPQKRVYLWFDATANFKTFSYIDSIEACLQKAKSSGVTDVIIDVKPISGEVLFPSRFAPRLLEWKGFTRPEGFDYLNIFIAAARDNGLRILCAVNVFSEGNNFYKRIALDTVLRPWHSIHNTRSGMKKATRHKELVTASVNPADTAVQNYEIAIVKELVSNYDIDGIVLDRAKYDGIDSDFSPLSKSLFQQYSGLNVSHFPADIFKWKKQDSTRHVRIPGRHYKKWIEWRASVIHDFFQKLHNTIKTIKPNIVFANFTGSYYSRYYENGVNWASVEYDPSSEYEWATSSYKNFAIAELVDVSMLGCFYPEVTASDLEMFNKNVGSLQDPLMRKKEAWACVENSCAIARKVIKNKSISIGSLFAVQYKDVPAKLVQAIELCYKNTDGVMLFDVSNILKYNLWHTLEEGIKKIDSE